MAKKKKRMSKELDMDFRQYSHLEFYLLDTVQPRFRKQGYLLAFDFFCIVIWKANRAKSHVAKKLLNKRYKTLRGAAKALTIGLNKRSEPKDKLCYLFKDWKLNLPMASAILAILYPEEFTVYDVRVCDTLGDFHKLRNRTNFDNLWQGYQEFKSAVIKTTPDNFTLRDRDRLLWGQDFHKQLLKDIRNKFNLE